MLHSLSLAINAKRSSLSSDGKLWALPLGRVWNDPRVQQTFGSRLKETPVRIQQSHM